MKKIFLLSFTLIFFFSNLNIAYAIGITNETSHIKQGAGIGVLGGLILFGIIFALSDGKDEKRRKENMSAEEKAIYKNRLLLKGKSHIFFCNNCESTYSQKSNDSMQCPDCGVDLFETKILTVDWRKFDTEKKAQMKSSFKNNENLVTSVILPKTNNEAQPTTEKNRENPPDSILKTIDNSEKLFCRKCGKELASDSEFCHSCGTKVIK